MIKSAKNGLRLSFVLLSVSLLIGPFKAQGQLTDNGFKKLPSGLEYKIITRGDGKRNPQLGDHIAINIFIHLGDSVMFDSRKAYDNKPVPLSVATPINKGDIMEGLMVMVTGDSAVFRQSVDSLKKIGGPLPAWAKNGEKIEYQVRLISVKSTEEEKIEKVKITEKQKIIDDKILQDYFARHTINATRTPSGLYYKITSPGMGDRIVKGNIVLINYTGMFTDGRKFDSNTDSTFHHVQPYRVEVGKGQLLKGWEEILPLLKEGTRATIYVPSGLANGDVARNGIPANSVLIFDLQIIKVLDPSYQQETDDKLIQTYIEKTHSQFIKMPSGFYIAITQKGMGTNTKPGQKVTMNYTGKTLDGTVFDSNVDPAFGHKVPYSFRAGFGQVIKGWDEAVLLMKQGTKATILVPSSLAYGSQGNGSKIKPDEVLLYEIEVTNIENN